MSLAIRMTERLACALDEQGVSQAAAGAALAMSQAAVSRRMTGQTPWRLDELEALAAALNLELVVELVPVPLEPASAGVTAPAGARGTTVGA